MATELELLATLWPILLGFITLVIVLAQMYSRIGVLEEKVRLLFDLHNQQQRDKQ